MKSKILTSVLLAMLLLGAVLPTFVVPVQVSGGDGFDGYWLYTGAHIQNDKLKVGIAFYPSESDESYAVQYVRVPIIPPTGIPVGLEGEAFKAWLESLPTKMQLNPVFTHFIIIDPSTTVSQLEAEIQRIFTPDVLASADAFLSVRGSKRAERVGFSSFRVLMQPQERRGNGQILPKGYNAQGLITAANNKFGGLSGELDGEGEILDIKPGTITIGAAAINRGSYGYISADTYVNKGGPADGSGQITSNQIWLFATTDTTDIFVGSFSASGDVLTVRDSESIGDVAYGSMQTQSGLTVNVETGDYWGCYDKGVGTTRIERDTSGYDDYWWLDEGECIDPSDSETFVINEGGAISLYGEGETPTPPSVVTNAASLVEETTTTANGEVTAINDTSITERGFVWDTSTQGAPGNVAPASSGYANNWTEEGSFGVASFSHGLTLLDEGELYYVRACAENDDTYWGYGSEVTFLTKPDEPTSLNGTPGDEHIDLTWAKGDGAQKTMIRFRTDGTYPTSYTDGTQAYYDTGESYDHTGLTNGLTYYYRAWSYATEGGKTQWSDTYSEYSGTPSSVPTVTSGAATSIEETSAIANGNITSLEGGGNCTIRGFQWDYDSGAPYSFDVHQDGDYGTGAFALSITGIDEGQLVYFRAYATNSNGTGYGGELTFLTKPDTPSTFTATADGETEIDLAWTNGDGSQKVYIRGKLGSAPTNRTDGAYSWNGTGTTTSHSGLSDGQHWYYIIWSYATEGALEQTSDTPDLSDDATTIGLPVVTSLVVEGAGSDAFGCWVILRGQVADDEGLAIDTIGFNYGLTAGYGSTVSESVDWNTGDDFVIRIGSLAHGTTYHWRAYATDGATTGYGEDMVFTTEGSASLYEYLNTGQDGDSTAIYAGNWTAEYFTTDATSHTVTSIRVYLKRVLLPGTITVSIKHVDDNNKPTGADICSGTYDGDNLSTSYGWAEFIVDEVSLEAEAEYAVVVRAIAGDAANYVMWGKDTGGGLALANGWSSADGGISWSDDSPIDYLFELWGYPVLSIESAAVFTGYLEDDDLLFVLEYINTYPPYYPDYDCPTYFSLQLFDTDGTTLIASTTCRAWGNKPGAIYLSADYAAPLTPDAAYYLKLVYNSDTDIVASYQLQTVDWKGDDLAGLDRWVITTAHSIETYYGGVALTEYVGVLGEVLNVEGGIVFATGIPALAEVRPDLFKVVVHTPGYEAEDWTDAFVDATDWETQIGATAAGILTAGGVFVGMDGKNFGTFILLLVYIAFALLLVGKQIRGGGYIGAGLAMPILMMGTWLRLMDIVFIAVTASIAIFLLVYSLFFART